VKKGDIALTYDQETNDMRYMRRKIAAGMGVPQSMLISEAVQAKFCVNFATAARAVALVIGENC